MGMSNLFVSATGEMLERWSEAFPTARAVSPERLATVAGRPDLLWLHLAVGSDPSALFGAVGQRWSVAPPVIVLAELPDDDLAMACFGLGARGFSNSHAQPDVLRTVADVVGRGGMWLGESLLTRLLRTTAAALPEPREAPAWAARLTEREREVALAIADGAANKEVARRLGITERTVKAHSGAIFQKLGVRDRLQLSLLIHRGS
jgi:DNA-binding NarL/FixJ family response regulator